MEQRAEGLRCRWFSVPKQGNSVEQNEDALGWDCDAARFAVSDGASESIFAGEWAKILTEGFIAAAPSEATFGEWLHANRKRWLSEMDSRAVPWYVEEKLRDGAFATFLGVTLEKPNREGVRNWSALAVGDCCLFHVVDHRIQTAFPVESSTAFGTRPTLVRSTIGAAIQPVWTRGTARPGDQLWLMSDALAQWFLRQHEAGRKPWQEFAGMTVERFPRWTEILRKSRAIQNDDVSLLAIELEVRDAG